MPRDADFVGRRSLAPAAALASFLLSACADGAPAPSDLHPAGLFRVDHPGFARLAPGPQATWYTARPRYFEIGFADWRAPLARPKRGLRGWFQRLWRRSGRNTDESTGVIDAHASLPLPADVEVTNLQTGARLIVRIQERAPLHGPLISLAASAARRLNADPAAALLVRVRYSAPVIVYREGSELRLARARAPSKLLPMDAALPATSQPTRIAAAPSPPRDIAALAAPRLAQPEPVARLVRSAPAEVRVGRGVGVQAGAFTDPVNAERAKARLAQAGPARVETLQRHGGALYLVMVGAPSSKTDARMLRARVADLGFPDAMIRGF